MSPLLYALETALERHCRQHVRGRVLDVGCGLGPYRPLLEKLGDRYESLDVEKGLPDQTYVADVQSMPEVGSSRYHAVLCSEVLEHIPRPASALSEIRRILEPGGVLLITVPFLGRLHEEPHDYYRYTKHGLRYLLEANGFTLLTMERIGSLFGFAGHQISTILVVGTWHLPGIRWVMYALNAVLVTLPCHLGDEYLGSEKLPVGYVAVARRG